MFSFGSWLTPQVHNFTGPSPDIFSAYLHQIPVRLYSKNSRTFSDKPFNPFRHDPLYATFIMLGILGTFKPYTTLSDPGLFLSMIAIFPETYPCNDIHFIFWLNFSKSSCRFETSYCHRPPASPFRFADAPLPSPMVDPRHRQREFLLRDDTGFCMLEWRSSSRFHMGRATNSDWATC